MRLTGSLPPCRVEKLWVQNGATFFFGPIFIHPEETAHEPTKMFYKKEVFLSNLEEACPLTCVIGSLPRPPRPPHVTHHKFNSIVFV